MPDLVDDLYALVDSIDRLYDYHEIPDTVRVALEAVREVLLQRTREYRRREAADRENNRYREVEDDIDYLQ